MSDRIDPESRLEALLDRFEPRVRRQFATMVSTIKKRLDLDTLSELIERGNLDEALRLVQGEFIAFATSLTVVFSESAEDTARFLRSGSSPLSVSFDVANPRAVAAIQRRQLRIVSSLTQQARETIVGALIDGQQRGLNPRAQARLFRNVIGLTDGQEQFVRNFRRQLENGERGALNRKLRDRRFDSKIVAAVEGRRPLTGTEVDRIVDRYRERFVRFRSETIARTESLRGVHEGVREQYEQAFESGALSPDQVTQIWNTSGDGRVRETHTTMEGQQQPVGTAFISGEGNRLEFPGDPSAPASETIQCRCIVSRRLTRL